MSTQVLPSFQGLGFDVLRTPMWSTIVQPAISGKETRIGLWSYPRWQWALKYNFLRQGTMQGGAFTEFSQYAGLFNILNGSYDSFLYTDADDNQVTNQGIGDGNGVQVAFQLVRSLGNFVEPIFAPNVVTNVKINGVSQSSSTYTISNWGDGLPGMITFNTPPGNGLLITVTYSYYFPVRFLADTLEFNKSLSTVWGLKAAKFISIK